MNFSEILPALKEGKMIKRESWQENHFVFMQVPSQISKEIVPKMQSLPQSVKDRFQKTFDNPDEQINSIYYQSQLAYVGDSNLIVGYSPSSDDVLAIDWRILEK